MFTFRPLNARDLTMLHEWLHRPHVSTWWQEPASLTELECEYFPPHSPDDSAEASIALLHGEPAGFIQSYSAMHAGDGWWEHESDPGTRGIDQFLADPKQLGRGLGTAMVCAYVERLFQDATVTKVQADPAPGNVRAIRCYLRAAFVESGLVSTPDGPALLLIRNRHATPACSPA